MKDLNNYELMYINGGDGWWDPPSLREIYEDWKEAVEESLEFLKSDEFKDFVNGFIDGFLWR